MSGDAPLSPPDAARLFVDTADAMELQRILSRDQPARHLRLVGSTLNQSFVARELERLEPALARPHQATDNGAISVPKGGGARFQAFAEATLALAERLLQVCPDRRRWQISAPLYSGATTDLRLARLFGSSLRRLAPESSLKIMLSPHEPASFLVARELTRAGIAVNFTCTFSVRQALVALFLSGPSLISIFLDRINSGRSTPTLGEAVVLEAQKMLRRHVATSGRSTSLVVANVKRWCQVGRLYRCDYFTVPPVVLDDAAAGCDSSSAAREVGRASPKEHPVADQDSGTGHNKLDLAGLARVDSELVAFLLGVRRQMSSSMDGDRLFRLFDDAGFADLFHSPIPSEWASFERSKLAIDYPELSGSVAPDTLFSLLAVADFQRAEERVMEIVRKRDLRRG